MSHRFRLSVSRRLFLLSSLFSNHTVSRFLLVALTLCALACLALQTPVLAAHAQSLPVDSLLREDGSLDLTRGANGTVDLRGWDIRVDPKRGPILTRVNAAPSAVDMWSALPGNGLNGYVDAMAVIGNTLYVGGFFSQTQDGSLTGLGNIAAFDGTNWSALPNAGLNGAVYALQVSGNDLYVGGHFTQTVSPVVSNLNHIAKFNGATWSTLASGLNDDVYALAVVGTDIYAGGAFASAVSPVVNNLNHIAKFNGTSWSALTNDGLNDDVETFAVIGSDLYVGGKFTQTFSGFLPLYRIAKFNSGWSALPNAGLNGGVYALAVSGTDVYVGGDFTATISPVVSNLSRIAKFNGATWSALPNGGLNSTVYPLVVTGSNLYVGGEFTQTVSPVVSNLNRVARFDGTTWSALPNNGLNTTVSSFIVFQNALYVGGSFSQTVSPVINNLYNIAKLSFASTQTGPTFTVNTDADTDDGLCDILGNGNGNADCTLREAINAANAQSGANIIQFDAHHAIVLESALPVLTGNMALDGTTYAPLIDGNDLYRALTIESAITVSVSNISFVHGKAEPASVLGNSGGAISNYGGTLNIRQSGFYANSADDYGGAISSVGTATVSNSTFDSNSAGTLGGGVSADNVTILNSTLLQNSSPSGAGIYAGGALTLKNTIIGGSTGPDCTLAGTMTSEQNNLIEDSGSNACAVVNGVNGDILGAGALIRECGTYSGTTTWLCIPDATSPAIDTGDDATCAAAPVINTDQRSSIRPFGAHCDIGSYEKTTADCVSDEKPAAPVLLKPTKNQTMNKTRVKFDWTDALCATSYKITVKNTTTGAKVTKTVTPSKATLTLAHGKQKWTVQACNANGCTKSKAGKFTN